MTKPPSQRPRAMTAEPPPTSQTTHPPEHLAPITRTGSFEFMRQELSAPFLRLLLIYLNAGDTAETHTTKTHVSDFRVHHPLIYTTLFFMDVGVRFLYILPVLFAVWHLLGMDTFLRR